MKYSWPLMKNNLHRKDLKQIIKLLKKNDPVLTSSKQVELFEKEWSKWIGIKHSVFVNSGSAANFLSLLTLKEEKGLGEIITSPLGWISNISASLLCGFRPVFVDINPTTLALDTEKVLKKLNRRTKAVLLTHVMGFNGLNSKLLKTLKRKNILLIEDACESYGATYKGKKCGTFGWVSNFSFYYGHHLTTIEGGMVCTNSSSTAEILRAMRNYGLSRGMRSNSLKNSISRKNKTLSKNFIFEYPSLNFKSTELNAALGRSQIKRLNSNNNIRKDNFNLFISLLDKSKFVTNFETKTSCNYAFVLIAKKNNNRFVRKIEKLLIRNRIEYRKGTAGGGNQLRQPYLKKIKGTPNPSKFPATEHVHFNGFYIGNYPSLEKNKIKSLCSQLNNL